jgi:hypothetical protein
LRLTNIAFRQCNVINGKARRCVIVRDCSSSGGCADRCVDSVRELNREGFVRFKFRIAIHQHRDLHARITRQESERAAIGDIIAVGSRRRTVSRIEIN